MAALAAAVEGQWGEAHRRSGHRILLWGTLGAVPVLCWGPLSPPEVTVRTPANLHETSQYASWNSMGSSSAGIASVSALHLHPHGHTTLGQQMLRASRGHHAVALLCCSLCKLNNSALKLCNIV